MEQYKKAIQKAAGEIAYEFGIESVEYFVFRAMMGSFDLFVKKQEDYGPTNIGVTGAVGIIVRMADKMSRLVNLFNSGKEPQNESVRDTFQDMLNYSAMAMVDMDGNWPRFTPEEAWNLELERKLPDYIEELSNRG